MDNSDLASLFEDLKVALFSGEQSPTLTPANIINVTVKTMSFVEKFIHEDGSTKKKVVLYFLNQMVQKFDVKDKELVDHFLNQFLDSSIDIIISVSNNEKEYKLRFNKFFQKMKLFFTRSCKCC